MPSPEAPAGPLAGMRVLDLCRVVSGPFCTMLLGDLGAEIVKVEEPGRGDESRTYGPPFPGGESAYFLSINRNKKSLVLDLKSPAGRDVALRLAARADVVVENFRPGALDRLGLGWEQLRAVNERVILCSISGFGRSGPDAGRPGYDLIVQGEAGIMDITGQPEGPPTKVGTSIADLTTGLYGAHAILAAIIRRDRTGEGGRVDVAMLDAVASLLTFNAGIYFASGRSPARRGNAHATISPYETFEASDGWLNVAVANDRFWAAFCPAIGLPALLDDPRFATPDGRVTHRPALQALLSPMFATEPRAHWIALLSRHGIPCGTIATVGEVCTTPQLVERGVVQSTRHPRAGEVRHLASAVRFDDAPPPPATPAPMLGEHTGPILADWLGLDARDVAELAAQKAFGLDSVHNERVGMSRGHII